MKRRSFVETLGVAALFGGGRRLLDQSGLGFLTGLPSTGGSMQQVREGFITDVGGLRVGHFTDTRRPTGCTVVIFDGGAVAGVDVRGSAPGTRETDLLKPTNTVDRVNAILLSGGSAFGLDAATGVVRYMEEHQQGFQTTAGKIPIVPAAILYDLAAGGDPKIRPDAEAGYRACVNAAAGVIVEGSVGAGAGALVGLLLGHPMKGGIGTASVTLPNGLIVGAIVAVNCAGDVIDPKTGKIVAGARTDDGRGFANIMETYRSGGPVAGDNTHAQNTTIGVVATNARFTKTQMTKIAEMGQDGFARAINPVHTPVDGDTLFAASTGARDGTDSVMLVGALAAEVVAEAILRGVMKAKGLPGIPSYQSIH